MAFVQDCLLYEGIKSPISLLGVKSLEDDPLWKMILYAILHWQIDLLVVDV